ncbi:DUF4062 domain-containing protein [Pseudomonas siliginis]|uniref:DUF4062 domain-containing protein n=1 Tax=Pseudomonas siliginis TaxID=2842346 RepID=UPI0020932E65|nr:DUF4062 domain-containing protein [Pseudomonas siliginis]UST97863.1 DUF4062 domain-containing protein [Pseudomonas siliginis]
MISFFLASPGDLFLERKVAKQVADELNSMLSHKLNVHIELVGWEDTVSSAGRPQEIINRDLERCDVFIGILWKRWGSAPDNESKYESGFEEEFTIATTGHKNTKKPLISLFFKKIDTPALSDPGQQLQKVVSFRKRIIEEKTLLFQEFENEKDFEGIIRKCISNYVLEHVEFTDLQPQAAQAPDADIEPIKSDQSKESFDFSPIKGESASFIQSVLRRSGDASNRAKLEPFEVARLRLISNGLGDGQNDSSYLGTHDANLIYRNKDKCEFDEQELLGLLQSGAKNLKYENIPIWYWLQHPLNKHYNLSFLTLTIPEGDHSIASSILDLMTLTGTKITSHEFVTRSEFVGMWLSEKPTSSVKNSALRYLSENGVEDDLDEILKEINKNNSQTITLAHEAYISIKLRMSLNSGLEAVNYLQPAALGVEIINSIFDHHTHIGTQDLNNTLENRNKSVRAKAVEILISRDLLPAHLIESIQQDSEPSVRALAIPALLKQGATLSDDEAKAIIMKDSSKPTTEENLAWSRFQPQIAALTDRAELERRMHRLLPISADAYIELARRNIDAQRSELTKNLLDKYEGFYKSHLRLWAEAKNDDPDETLKQFDSLKQYIINGFIRKTLTLLVEKKSKKDLAVIRASLNNASLSPIEADLEYFYSFGEWQDVFLVVDIFKRFGTAPNNSLLGGGDISKEIQNLAVKTILKLGKDRLADVLALNCPSAIRRNIISSIKDRDFTSFGDDVILGLLNNDDDQVRKHCALKCAKTYSKTRLNAIFDKYNQADQVFYNVIHWLDFGMHSSKEQIYSVFKKICVH